ncbi:hypothetical protein AFCA_011053 [Aspergillus flavus]|nr:hypothetical protein AFCA_011053 [Aspergillus flavus]
MFEGEEVLGSRPLDPKNVDRLAKIYEVEGCQQLEPEHRVAALIKEDILYQTIEQCNIIPNALFDYANPPTLSFNQNVRLLCLYGKHRLKAAEIHAVASWLVDLYLDDIPAEAIIQLREESTNAKNFKEGDCFRIYRHYKLAQNYAQERKWWARFQTDERRKHIRRLEQTPILINGFDLLLPYIGLWDHLSASQVRQVLGLRCHELVSHYLELIYRQWSDFFGTEKGGMVDAESVRLIEGRMPKYSLDDQSFISEVMRSGQLFPRLPEPEDRHCLLQKILQTPGRILSLHTLSQDIRFLESPAKAFRHLIPLSKKDTVNQALLKHFRVGDIGNNTEIQISEYEFSPAPAPVNLSFIGIIQLWLFALRHFTRPPKVNGQQQTEAWYLHGQSLGEMAVLATRLGFSSNRIRELQSTDESRLGPEKLFRSLCINMFYLVNDSKVHNMARHFNAGMRSLSRNKEGPRSPPAFTTERYEDMPRRRYNSPTLDEYLRDRAYLFVGNIYSADQSPSQYPTSFAVTREIIFAFFGKEPLYSIFSQRQPSSPSEVPELAREGQIPAPMESGSAVHDNTVVGLEQNNQALDANGDADEYGRAVTLGSPNDCQYEPVELLPHPPGTPDRSLMDVITDDVPLATGFEEHDSKAPLAIKAEISVHRKAVDILQMWYGADDGRLIVLFLFETRSYYKFLVSGGWELRSTLQDLSREHYFLVCNEFGIVQVEVNVIYDTALQHRLILVGKIDSPLHGVEDQEGRISAEKLREYISCYDAKTGKRKADPSDTRTAKRHLVS